MGYIMHAGQAQEPVPIRRGALNLYGQKGWYDFFATRASLTNDGFLDDSTVGMKHVAVRDSDRESSFKPASGNVCPRPKGWKPIQSNTLKPPVVARAPVVVEPEVATASFQKDSEGSFP
ncbi:uncharacterized protein MICPUCDRAFT_59667 [Micromonas pusilla CCMP1545]|uniref:Predicted protein n=1 Tax=Micromonas pusilla (strain CCMP1545) TaxID=564608 RepID=C1MW87_MICPC|nr:uncharacterized protein MICPUCDRAFT_59667 [Micromonas pusilla CCMP1545]EEH56124.1 predicted protein [Micromonas pusilla CCMP1545]|eukprot:XP_003060172.1 predicted protein [Micromonas pusilla CCMP1545]